MALVLSLIKTQPSYKSHSLVRDVASRAYREFLDKLAGECRNHAALAQFLLTASHTETCRLVSNKTK